MKKLINAVLAVCAFAMLFICYRSIADQQNFNAEIKQREVDVKARLIEIRKAQEAYKEQHNEYCSSWDTLIAFIKDGKLPIVIKQGMLTEAQMEKGLTDSKAAAIVARGNQAEIAAAGLQGFRRDTTWVSLVDSLYGKDYNVDEIRYIPNSDIDGSEKEEFELIAVWIKTKSDAIIPVMECGATFDKFLRGEDNKVWWKREVANRTEYAEKQGSYAGLKIGEAGLNWNNNAGNWE